MLKFDSGEERREGAARAGGAMARGAICCAAALALFGSGCDGRVVLVGNLTLAAIPCVLLWLTVNLEKHS